MPKLVDLLLTNPRLVRQNWHRPWIAIPITIATATTTLWCCNYFRTSPLSVVDGIVAAVAVALVLFCWLLSIRLPRVETGHLGFGIALVYDNDEQAKRIQDDFIAKMRSLVGKWPRERAVQFLVLPGRIAEELEITPPDKLEGMAARFANATGCQFMIWGRAKRRRDPEEVHILELRGLVRHRELDNEQKARLTTEFGNVFPNRVRVALTNDLLGFEVSANSLDLVAKYVVSLAAALSGDLKYANNLLERLSTDLNKTYNKDIVTTRLRSQVPKQLLQIRDSLLDSLMASYTRTRDTAYLEEIRRIIKGYEPQNANRCGVSLAKAICQFMLDRNVVDARKTLQAHQSSADPSAQVSLAFLDAYDGNLQEAYRRYMKIPAAKFDGAFAMDIEEFIQIVLENEPRQKQLLFLTGMINHRFKDDVQSARHDLKAFVSWAKKRNKYTPQVDAASKWLKEIRYRR